jgi:hypothetical protein
MGEIDLRIEGLSSLADWTRPMIWRQSQQGRRVSRPGDLWLLGEYRVLCASSLDRAAYATLMEEERLENVHHCIR